MRVCLLASGSSGNCAFVAAGGTRVLIDAGISARRVRRELEALGETQVDALLLTHEHGDHCSEAGRIAAEFGCPLYVSHRTLPHVRSALTGHERLELFRVGEAFPIGDLTVKPFRVFHDAADPCGFLLEGPSDVTPGRVRVGFATDLGTVPPPLRKLFRECEGLVIEANHDLEMLLSGPYAWDLKQRVRSPIGHLSNRAAADLIRELVQQGRLRVAVLAHLSEENNCPERALKTVKGYLDGLFRCRVRVVVAPRDRRSEVLRL